jgi:hypothetical protein
MYKIIIFSILFTFLSGCGGTGSASSSSDNDGDIVYDRGAKAYFGYLANAKVELYALNGETKQLLFTEYTTNGESLDDIGNFDPHMRDMDIEKRYMYQVSGGMNWDTDEDGIKDSEASANKKVYRAIYQAYKPKVAWWVVQTGGNNMAPSE